MTTSQITGADDAIAELRSLPDKLRRQALRNALAAGGRVVRDAAKARAPVLRRGTQYRTPGLVRDSIVVRTSRRDRQAGDVGVFVNVRPAKGVARGAKSKSDPYYWRWIEFGRSAGQTKRKRGFGLIGKNRRTTVNVGAIQPARFLADSADAFPAAKVKIEAGFVREVEKLNRRRPDAK